MKKRWRWADHLPQEAVYLVSVFLQERRLMDVVLFELQLRADTADLPYLEEY